MLSNINRSSSTAPAFFKSMVDINFILLSSKKLT